MLVEPWKIKPPIIPAHPNPNNPNNIYNNNNNHNPTISPPSLLNPVPNPGGASSSDPALSSSGPSGIARSRARTARHAVGGNHGSVEGLDRVERVKAVASAVGCLNTVQGIYYIHYISHSCFILISLSVSRMYIYIYIPYAGCYSIM